MIAKQSRTLMLLGVNASSLIVGQLWSDIVSGRVRCVLVRSDIVSERVRCVFLGV